MWFDIFIRRKIIPDFLIRAILKIYLKFRFRKEPKNIEEIQKQINNVVERMKQSPISIKVDFANKQHYELPPEFFQLTLGKHLKYSCGLWKENKKKKHLLENLDKSEKDMLDLTLKHADIVEGHKVLDLGCGWGSFSLFLSRLYPECQITAVSNSIYQKKYIESQIDDIKIKNLKVIKANVNNFQPNEKFDRIVSIEMFEHMRNYEALLKKLTTFLTENGKLFIHIFTDNKYPYFFEVGSRSTWMATNYFRGGLMPSANLIFYFLKNFSVEKAWKISGKHYKNTLNAWLSKMDKNKKQIRQIFSNHYGPKNKRKWFNYWRMFFLSLSEVFGYKAGNKRYITHYLLVKK